MAKKPFTYPQELLRPIGEYLRGKLDGLEKRKKDLEKTDPFSDKTRVSDNADILDDAAEVTGHVQAQSIKKAVTRSIIQVRKALSSIKFGRYGVCERCGKMIDTDRLMVIPETTICVDCESRREA